MNNKKSIFESINPIKAILTLAIPTIISQLIDVFYNLADTFFLGRTGNPYMIASTGIAIGLFAIGVVISNLFGIGGGTLIARLLAVKENEKIKIISSFSLFGGILVSIIYSLIVLIFMKPILTLLGASSLTYEYCKQYTSIIVVFGVPLVCLSNTISHLLRNVGFSFHAGFGLSIGGLLNIGLDPLFMFVIFPAGKEVIAAATATLISSIVSLIYLLIVFIITKKKTGFSFSLKYLFTINKEDIKNVLKIGIPSSLLVFLFIISQMITLSVMAKYGDFQVAAIGIVIKVEKIANAICLGVCQGMLPIVAYNYSSKNILRMKKVIKSGLFIGLISSLICSLIFVIFSNQIISLFLASNTSDSETTIYYGSLFLKYRFLVPIFMFLNYYASYSLQALNDGRNTFIHAFVRIVVIYIPLIFLGSFLFNEIGLALSFELSELLAAVLGFILFSYSYKRRIL